MYYVCMYVVYVCMYVMYVCVHVCVVYIIYIYAHGISREREGIFRTKLLRGGSNQHF